MLNKVEFDQLVNTRPSSGGYGAERSLYGIVFRFFRDNLPYISDVKVTEYTERYFSELFKQMQAETKEQGLVNDDLFESFELGHNFVIHK